MSYQLFSPGNAVLSDDHITIWVNDKFIQLVNDVKKTSTIIVPRRRRFFEVKVNQGVATIHITSKKKLKKRVTLSIDVGTEPKLIVGTPDPLLSIKFLPANSKILFLSDDKHQTYEANLPGIRQWNEDNRVRDSFFKSIRRRIIYFFGRDLRFTKNSFAMNWRGSKKSTAHVTKQPVSCITTSADIATLQSIALPADILLRYQEGYPLDKYFVGTWQHAGIFYKKGYVIDAMGNGTYLRTIEQFAEADGIVLIRINNLSRAQIHLAISYALEQVGKSYSVDFDDNTQEQYCSGLIINAFKYAGVLPPDYKTHVAIRPDDLLQIPGSRILWTNRNDLLQNCKKLSVIVQ